MCGAIDGPLREETLPQCDLILVAIRPQAAVDWVKAHAAELSKSAILVDLCGVKRVVVEQLAPIAAPLGLGGLYIGAGHDMGQLGGKGDNPVVLLGLGEGELGKAHVQEKGLQGLQQLHVHRRPAE